MKLEYRKLPSTVAFNFNLRRYIKGTKLGFDYEYISKLHAQ